MSDTITEPMPLGGSAQKHRWARFDSTVTMGTLMQMGIILVGMIAGYGKYSADQAAAKMEVEQIKVDAAGQRNAMKEQLADIRSDVKDVQKTLVEVNQNMAVLKARSEPQRQR